MIYKLLSKRERDAALKVAVKKLEAHGYKREAAKLREMVSKKAPPKRTGSLPTSGERRASKKQAHAEETSTIRAAVMARADGRCEACGMHVRAGDRLELDHLLRGAGVRRQEQSVQTTWAIHLSCHRARTEGKDLAWWTFSSWPLTERAFLVRHGYPTHPLMERRWRKAASPTTTSPEVSR